MKIEAKFYQKLKDKRVKCTLCPHECLLSPGQRGICKVRKNISGQLYSLNYGNITSMGIDPIEKKPLYHFFPSSNILSIGSSGCNLLCPFCQNIEISDADNVIETKETTPQDIIKIAKSNNSFGIAYTYNEPTVFYEFVHDTSVLAKKSGIKNVWVTNGNISMEALKEIRPYMDAANIDLKSFNSDFYSSFVSGDLETTKDTIAYLFKEGVHIEITFLTITNKNDSSEEMENIAKWIASISHNIPLHISRYFPMNKILEPPTSLNILNRNYDIGKKYLKYVYLGNVMDKARSNTYCPNCNTLLIERRGYQINDLIKNGSCPKCHTKIYGEFNGV
ncbi:AmmeMemoRadiSam system radical SAM enzyme [bacterium]|nr:AmmeMemoRadiSam system radical SAM enzyme [bacterium]